MIVAVPMPPPMQSVMSAVLAGALELVERGAEDHGSSRAQRMAHRDRAAVDVDLVVVEVETLRSAARRRRKPR